MRVEFEKGHDGFVVVVVLGGFSVVFFAGTIQSWSLSTDNMFPITILSINSI